MAQSPSDDRRRPWEVPEPRAHEQEYVSFTDVWRFVRRYSVTISVALVAGIVLAAVLVFTATPRYTATAEILIDPATIQIVRDPTPGAQAPALDVAQVEGQIAVLRSESLATGAIDKLDLMKDKEFQPGPPSLFAQLGGLLMRGIVSSPEPPRGDLAEYARRRIAVEAFLKDLDVRRVGQSYAISISFTSVDPAKAARIANTLAELYIQDQLKANARAAQQGSEWLEKRLGQLKVQLNKAARELEAFRAGRSYRLPQQRKDVAGDAAAARPPAEGTDTGRPVEEQRQPRGTGRDRASQRAVTLTELETTAETYRRIYETYQRAFTEAVQRQSFPVSNARIITEATRPLLKSEPRGKLILAFGGLTGLLAGFGVAFMRNALDDSVRSAWQIREQTGLPCLTLIPQLEKVAPTAPAGGRSMERLPSPETVLEGDEFRMAINAPFSPFAGALKALKAAIVPSGDPRAIKCVGIISALPEEGKSTVAANLAALFSASAGRTLILDCDIHRAAASAYFAPGAETGLLEVLGGSLGYERAIKTGSGLTPDILPLALSDAPVSYDLLTSPAMRSLLRSLRDHYDMIVADLPPVNPIVDAATIAALLDGVILVTEWGVTPIDVVTGAAGVLFTAQANVLGVALNKVDKSLATVRWRKQWGYGYYRAQPAPEAGRTEGVSDRP